VARSDARRVLRTLLHLHPGDARARRELISRQGPWLSERGVELVLGDDVVAPSDGELYSACVALPPEHEVEGSLARLLDFARSHRIDGVLAQTESGVAVGSLLARELCVPGPSPDAVVRCVGKHLTREALAVARVPQPAFKLASSSGDVRRFGEAHGYPLILKPLASCMARLVTRVDRPEEVEAAVARLLAGLPRLQDVARLLSFARAAKLDAGPDPRATFLCETLAPGEPVETDGFVVAGRARAFGVMEQRLTREPPLFVEGYLLPADRPDSERLALQGAGERAAVTLGLDSAGFCVEMRADGGLARVIEVNGRLGEDHGLHRLFELACGADPFRASVEVALGGRPSYAARATPRHALAYRCTFDEGVVAAIPGAAEIAALAVDRRRVVEADVCVSVGATMHAPPHPETYPHLAWLLARDDSSSRKAFAHAGDLVGRLRFSLVQSAPP